MSSEARSRSASVPRAARLVTCARRLDACARRLRFELHVRTPALRAAALLLLCALCACAGPKYWSFGISSAVYDHMDGDTVYRSATANGSATSGNPGAVVLFLLPIVLDLVLLPIAATHDLVVYLFG